MHISGLSLGVANACSRCQKGRCSLTSTQRNLLAYSSRLPSSSSSSSPQKRRFSLVHIPASDSHTRIAQIPTRSIIAIEGRDTIKLLQGLTTNSVTSLKTPNQSTYCAFLNPQGRMLSTAFLYLIREECVLVDVDTGIASELLAFIKKFKLRSKVTLRDVSEEYRVWGIWGGDGKAALDQSSSSTIIAAAQDVRTPLMGHRLTTSRTTAQDNNEEELDRIIAEAGLDSSSVKRSSSEAYTIHRILQGVPDGIEDIWANQSLPLEANVDFMNGVDFRKGCYVGQELTARTHHTGVVRKRIIPVSFYTGNDPPETLQVDTSFTTTLPSKGSDVRSAPMQDKSARGKSAGKYLSGVHNIGLALLRLEQVHRWNKDLLIKVKAADDTDLNVRPWIPSWWPQEAQKPID